jgi:tetratricopeptide (TPR) repeat protein
VDRKPAAPPWLFSAPLDLLVGCGAWSLPLLALTFYFQRENTVAVSLAFYLLAVFCNNPHYMATVYRAYHTADDFKKYRFFTLYVTVLLALTVVLAHLLPGLFPWVITLYLTWSPWHYTGQNFGIAQMLARRAGAPPDRPARQLLWASYAAAYGVWFLTLHTAREAGDPYFISLGFPSSFCSPAQLVLTVAFLGCAAAAFFRLARHLPARALAGPALLTVTQLLWFVAPALAARFGGLELPASYFSAGALAFMHCAQYLWITSYYARRENPRPGAGRFRFARYYLLLVVGGLALFVPGPWIASRLLGHDFVESFMIFMALVNLHHFILDGAIWKLRDGRIARLLLGSNRTPEPAQAAADDPGDSHAHHHLGWLFGPSRPAVMARGLLGAGLLALGALDQYQYFSTTHAATPAELARAAALNPSDPRPYFRHAQLLAAAGDLAGAETEVRRVLAINPHNAPAQHLLGELLFRSGDTAAALEHYDRMARLFRPDLAIAYNRGLLSAERGHPADAAARFEAALRLAPHRTELHFLLGQALADSGDAPRAIAQFELFTALCEADSAASAANLDRYLAAGLKLGELYLLQNDPARAEHWLQRTADLAATKQHFATAARALNQLAALQEKSGRTADAGRNRTLASQAAAYAR